MENTVFYIVLCFLLPILYLCVYLEKRARRIMISFCFGIIACMLAYCLNTTFLQLFSFPENIYTMTISPIVEELLKFLPILLISVILNKGRRASTANAYAVGIGFCLVENTTYLITQLSSVGIVWVLFRGIGTGLMHGMSATILGLGIYTARQKKNSMGIRIFLTFLVAVAYHSLFNFLVDGNAVMRIFAVLMPLLTHLLIFLLVKKEDIRRFIEETEENNDNTENSETKQ